MKPRNVIRTFASIFGAVAASAFLAAPAFAQQASISLQGSSLKYCNKADNAWTITKTADKPATETYTSGVDSVTWTITATKNGVSSSDPQAQVAAPKVLCAEGTITISNSGVLPATVGNIVVNLQKNVKVNGKFRWVSAAANVATSLAGNSASSANIVASASAENEDWNCVAPNATACNYSVEGQTGTFIETGGSGSIEFTVEGNPTFSITNPPFAVDQGAPITLSYKATFDNDVLGLTEGGTQLRTEVIVTFGNAGGRGGSGASATGIDINGDGQADGNVRSVPIRLTQAIPAFENCNDTVSLLDAFSTGGNASISAPTSNNLPSSTSTGGQWTIVTPVFGSGTVTNTVDLFGPAYADDACCEIVDLTASSTVTVVEDCLPGECVPPPPCPGGRCPPPPGQFCTYTQGGWGSKPAGNNPGTILANNWTAVFGGGLVVGTSPAMTWTEPKYISGFGQGKNAVPGFLPQGGTSGGVLTENLVNPDTSPAGNFGGQVTALTINLAMSGTGTPSGLGSVLVNTSAGWVPVSTLVGWMHIVISGGTADLGLTELHSLAGSLNEGFDNCNITGWALANTSPGAQ